MQKYGLQRRVSYVKFCILIRPTKKEKPLLTERIRNINLVAIDHTW